MTPWRSLAVRHLSCKERGLFFVEVEGMTPLVEDFRLLLSRRIPIGDEKRCEWGKTLFPLTHSVLMKTSNQRIFTYLDGWRPAPLSRVKEWTAVGLCYSKCPLRGKYVGSCDAPDLCPSISLRATLSLSNGFEREPGNSACIIAFISSIETTHPHDPCLARESPKHKIQIPKPILS